MELVIQGINLKDLTPDKQAQVLDLLAQLTGADRSQLQITKLEAGSIHVFVDMPRRAAYELKTAALNKDPRFKQLGIVSLRLDGDQNFVSVASGKLTALATVSPLMALWLKIPALFSSALGATGGKSRDPGSRGCPDRRRRDGRIRGAHACFNSAHRHSGCNTDFSLEPSPTFTVTVSSTETSTPTQTVTATLTPTETLTPTFLPHAGANLSNVERCTIAPDRL